MLSQAEITSHLFCFTSMFFSKVREKSNKATTKLQKLQKTLLKKVQSFCVVFVAA